MQKKIVDGLNNHKDTKSHSRHITMEECSAFGLKVIPLEEYMKEENFQDIVLTIHHAYMHTFSNSNAFKIIENHRENAMIQQQMQQLVQMPQALSVQQPPQNMQEVDLFNQTT